MVIHHHDHMYCLSALELNASERDSWTDRVRDGVLIDMGNHTPYLTTHVHWTAVTIPTPGHDPVERLARFARASIAMTLAKGELESKGWTAHKYPSIMAPFAGSPLGADPMMMSMSVHRRFGELVIVTATTRDPEARDQKPTEYDAIRTLTAIDGWVRGYCEIMDREPSRWDLVRLVTLESALSATLTGMSVLHDPKRLFTAVGDYLNRGRDQTPTA